MFYVISLFSIAFSNLLQLHSLLIIYQSTLATLLTFQLYPSLELSYSFISVG
jgi:hypothetical protein